MSYNANIYRTSNPHYYTPDEFGLLVDTNHISQPDAPIIRNDLSSTATGVFVVQGNIPVQGNVQAMEFWYSSNTSTFSANNFTLYGTQYYASDYGSSGSLYPHVDNSGTTFYEQIQIAKLPSNTYWWVTRAKGANANSPFSNPSAPFTWVATATTVYGNQVLDNSIAGSKVVAGNGQKNSSNNGFASTLGTAAAVGLVGLAAYSLLKDGNTQQGVLDAGTPDGSDPANQPAAPGQDPGTQPTKYASISTEDENPNPNPEQPQTVVVDATPDQPPVQMAQNSDGTDLGDGNGGSSDEC